MKKFYLFLSLVFCLGVVNAQQVPYYSQYMVNPYLLNPGVAGSDPDLNLNLGYRTQWAGLDDAPKTGVISMHTRFKKKHGAGFLLMSDKTGPTQQTGAQLSYAYHLTLNSSGTRLGLGLAAQLFQHSLAADKLTTDQPGDIAIQSAFYKTFAPDAMFGAWVYHKKYFAGLSAPQLLQSKLDFNGNQGSANQLKRHLFLMGGYRHDLNEDFQVEPSILFKYVAGAPMQFDLNVKGMYKEKFWLGLSYRDKESVVTMLGINSDFVSAGYAYDITLSDLKKYSSGSHEIFLSIRIVDKDEPAPEAKPEVQPFKLPGNEQDPNIGKPGEE